MRRAVLRTAARTLDRFTASEGLGRMKEVLLALGASDDLRTHRILL